MAGTLCKYEEILKVIQLEVRLLLKLGKEEEFLDIFKTQFAPAMSKQAGFNRVSFLKQREGKSQYRIEIVFESEKERLAWVKTKEHEEIWPKLADLTSNYSATGFDFLAQVSP